MDPLRREITNNQLLPLLQAIEAIRVEDPEMTSTVISVFLYVASHEGCHKQAIEEDLGISTSNSSRAADWLLNKKTLRKSGNVGLITKEKDPANNRRITFQLTDKGKVLARKLMDTIYLKESEL